ncbi:hypothetical protein [Streptomyces sp. NPDC005283]|uniref:hypothetical protein n=1 Tax=Streptomyces sp. NPDC005283 TaxID=3156871 RepID=UPI0034524D38
MNPINALGETGVDLLVCGPGMHAPPSWDLLRTPWRPPVRVVVDSCDDVRFTRAALQAHSPAAGHLVVHPADPHRERQVWNGLREALGDGPALPEGSPLIYGKREHKAAYAAARARPARTVTLLRTHLLHMGMWADLVHLHRTTRVDFILVHHAELPEDLRHLLQHCDHRVTETLEGMRAFHSPRSLGPAQP